MSVGYFTFFPSPDSGEQQVAIDADESVLDALLRAGIDVPYGCRSGICQSCIMQAPEGEIPRASQQGLRPQQVDQGLFLSCQCRAEDFSVEYFPSEDGLEEQNRSEKSKTLKVQAVDISGQQHEARVLDIAILNAKVIRLRIEKCSEFKSGQFFTLWKDKHTARSYSTASVCNADDFIEFHIKHIEEGAFSGWAAQELATGQTLRLQGPLGNCYYSETDLDAPLFLSGIGTGLAPLVGILRDALHQGHRGNITLVIGNSSSDGFYLLDELRALQQQHSNLSLHLIAQDLTPVAGSAHTQIQKADIYHYVKECVDSFAGYRIFLCGAASFVQRMKKLCFINGAKMSDIQADAFIPFSK